MQIAYYNKSKNLISLIDFKEELKLAKKYLRVLTSEELRMF